MAPKLKRTDGGRESSGFNESKDCTVRSFAVAADIPYATAHDVAKRSGRTNRKGWWTEKVLAVAIKDGLVEVVRVELTAQMGCLRKRWRFGMLEEVPAYPTLTEVSCRLPKGRYILNTRKHATALIDGEIHDTGMRPRAGVVAVWEIRLKEKPVAPITQAQVNELWERLNRLEAR